jgi:hypothetical protein
MTDQEARQMLVAAIGVFIDARNALLNAAEHSAEYANEENAYQAAEQALFDAYDAAAA